MSSFIVAALLWKKVSAEATQAFVDYEEMYKEVGLKKPEPYEIQNSLTRLKEEQVVIPTGRCAFKRGPNSKVTGLSHFWARSRNFQD